MTADVQLHAYHDAMEHSGRHNQHGMGDTTRMQRADHLCFASVILAFMLGALLVAIAEAA